MKLYFSGILSEIGKEFDINHQQEGLLQTAFIICYFASAPIFGFLGDRYSRKKLMLFGIFAWGSCTAISSFMPVSVYNWFPTFFCLQPHSVIKIFVPHNNLGTCWSCRKWKSSFISLFDSKNLKIGLCIQEQLKPCLSFSLVLLGPYKSGWELGTKIL